MLRWVKPTLGYLVLDSDGALLTEDSKMVGYWTSYFKELY